MLNKIQNYSTDIQELVHHCRTTLLTLLPDVQETADENAGILAYVYGPGYKDTICTLIPSKKQVKLGFYKGSELDDPENLLEGTGKVHKYVVIDKPEKLQNKALAHLILQALEAYRKRK